MRAFLVVTALVLSGCVEGTLAHYEATLEHVADCTIVGGVEDCRDPGEAAVHVHTRMSVDERGDDSRLFLREDTLLGPISDNTIHVQSSRESIYEQSGCKSRQSSRLDGWIDDPGFGMRRQVTGTMDELTLTEGDQQACGRNVPYGTRKKYRVTAVEVFNP